MMAVPRLTFLFGALMVLLCSQMAVAQDDDDIQSWNDVQITVPLSKKVDFFTKLTLRFGKNVSRLNDGRHAVGVVWKPIPNLSISPFYWFVRARNSAGSFRTENRFNLSATYRFPVKRFGLSHRSTYERRLRAAGTPGDTGRWLRSIKICRKR